MKNVTCCFTGHRPEKLSMPESQIRLLLEDAVKTAVSEGFYRFISGMARGIDIWAAEEVLKLKEKHKKIELICVPPYDGFEKGREEKEKEQYEEILAKADQIEYVCKHYSRQCFQMRNVYMVDNSSRVIAAFNKEKGGTKNTIQYAERKGVEVINILPEKV